MQNRLLFTVCVVVLLGLSSLSGAERDGQLPQLAKMGSHEAVLGLLKTGVDVDSVSQDQSTALHWAVYQDDNHLTRLLLSNGADPNAVNRNGTTPLTLACTNANAGLVNRLLDAGADPVLAPTGEPPLLTCSRTGSVAAVKALLSYGANVNATESWRNQTSLMWTANEGHIDVMRALLERGASIDAASNGGVTALMFAVRQNAQNAVRLLIDAGAAISLETDPNQTRLGAAQNSVLSLAIQNTHYSVAAMLLDAGADPNTRDGRGNTPLHDLVTSRSPRRHLGNSFVEAAAIDPSEFSSLDLMHLLLTRGADINARTEPVPIVHERWTDEGISSAGRPFIDNRINLGGATPYLLATQAADLEVMQVLAANGADPRLASYANNTPLMVAAGVGHVEGSRRFKPEEVALEAVKFTLAAGVDVNASNANGQTALHGAVYRAADSIVQHLMDAGAKTDFKDELGRTALDLAEQGFNQVASLIRRDRTAELLRTLGAASGNPKETE